MINKSHPPPRPSLRPQTEIDRKQQNNPKYSLHEGLQAAKNLVQMLNSLSNDGTVVLTNTTLRRGKKTLNPGAAEYFRIALSAIERALETCAPNTPRAVRERY